jgi:transcriptional regulator GlxA family with amidase domain
MSPAKAVERLRAESARGALGSNRRTVKEVAQSCGFGSAERMRRNFLRVFGLSPGALKF